MSADPEVLETPEIAHGFVIGGHDLLFYPEAHRYFVDGRPVDSVTQIIGATWPELYAHSNEFAMERGSVVHEITSLYDDGTLDEDSVSPIVSGFFDAYKRFLAETGFIVEENERKVYSDSYNYAGTLDRIGRLGAKRVLIDIKTGNPGWQCGPQTAAYSTAWHEETGEFIRTRYGLWLRESGEYSLIPFRDFQNDFADFTAAQRVIARRRQIA